MVYSKKLVNITVLLFTIVVSSKSFGGTIQIEFTENDSYNPEVVRVNIGDTIKWLPESEGHNVEFFAGPDMDSLPKKSEIDEFHSIIFEIPGVYLYGCTPHANMGMLGLIIVGNDFHNIEKIKKIKLSRIASSVLKRLIKTAQSDSN